jgi:hypothetical protein
MKLWEHQLHFWCAERAQRWAFLVACAKIPSLHGILQNVESLKLGLVTHLHTSRIWKLHCSLPAYLLLRSKVSSFCSVLVLLVMNTVVAQPHPWSQASQLFYLVACYTISSYHSYLVVSGMMELCTRGFRSLGYITCIYM